MQKNDIYKEKLREKKKESGLIDSFYYALTEFVERFAPLLSRLKQYYVKKPCQNGCNGKVANILAGTMR